MKIKNIYLNKKTPVISIAIALLCVIITLISQLVPSTYMAFTFSYPVKYPWQLITTIFLQGIPAPVPQMRPGRNCGKSERKGNRDQVSGNRI